jgi:hypothetical protein
MELPQMKNNITSMRINFIILLSCIFFLLDARGLEYSYPNLNNPPDTVPAFPPGSANELTGPVSACTGETSGYYIDVPVGCICQWSVNGIIQPGSGSPMMITWTQPGLQVVSVVFVCSGGQVSDPETISVTVFEIPQPGPITGDELVCEYTYHAYSTVAGPYDSCEWSVNGVIQPGYAPSITYSFDGAGMYFFEVIVFNPCGTSAPQTLEVTAQGTAPSTPSPIQGAGESCSGNTDIYTTTVGPGESCSWWIDGVLQPFNGTTLEVTWSEWGEHLIEVRAVSDCGTGNPALKNVLVFYQPSVFLGNDTTIMQGQTLILDAGNPGSGYLWSTGATTRTIPVGVTGIYAVNVSNFCGADADTIEVTVFVGIIEPDNAEDCFRLTLQKRNIYLTNLPRGTARMQIINLQGEALYDGQPVGKFNVDRPGIYFIRVISGVKVCQEKIFIP